MSECQCRKIFLSSARLKAINRPPTSTVTHIQYLSTDTAALWLEFQNLNKYFRNLPSYNTGELTVIC